MGSKTRAGLVGLDNNPTNSERSDLSSLPQLIAKRVSISERSDEDKQEPPKAEEKCKIVDLRFGKIKANAKSLRIR